VKTTFLLPRVLPAALVLFSAAIFTFAQELPANKQNARPQPANATRPPSANPSSAAKYSYEFNQPKFYVRHIVVQHDANGHGTITFERLNEDVSVTEPLEISPTAWARISSHWEALKFLDSDTNYQSSQHFAHLGTMKIGMELGERKRVAEFDWTHNEDAAALVAEYRRVSDQAILVFDISVARENQPLNAPKLMEVCESLLKRDGLSDPKQLVPLLKDISTDDHVPLIARNHALRLIKQIEK